VRYLGLTYSAESVYDSGSEIARVKLMKYARELKMEEEGEKGQKLASIKRDILPCKVIRVERFQFLSWFTLFIEIINSKARHNLINAKCRWHSNRLDGAVSFREPLGQTKVIQIRQRETQMRQTQQPITFVV
jgi:hypothetical protein